MPNFIPLIEKNLWGIGGRFTFEGGRQLRGAVLPGCLLLNPPKDSVIYLNEGDSMIYLGSKCVDDPKDIMCGNDKLGCDGIEKCRLMNTPRYSPCTNLTWGEMANN